MSEEIMAFDEINERLARCSIANTRIIKFRNEWMIRDYKTESNKVYPASETISSRNPDIGDEWNVEFRKKQTECTDRCIYGQLEVLVTQSDILLKKPILLRIRLTVLKGESVINEKSKDIFCGNTKNISDPIIEMNVGNFLDDLVNGNLIVACEMYLVVNPVNMDLYIAENEKVKFHTRENDLSRDMETLFDNEELYNFTFKFGDRKIRSSTDILSARSKVFAEMFDDESESIEKREKCTEITDIDFEVFREMLFYIHTDKVPKLNEMTEKLLAAAEKYKLENLKVICQGVFLTNISIDNVLDVIRISDECNCPKLRHHAAGYICMNMEIFLKSDGYQSLKSTNLAQAEKIIFEVVNHEEYLNQRKINRKFISCK